MGVDLAVQLVAGVDAEEAVHPARGSLLDRYRAGEFGADPDAEGGKGAMEAWFQQREPGNLSAWVAGSRYDDTDEGWRVVVGVEVVRLWNRDSLRLVGGPVALDGLRAALARAREGLQSLGVDAEPRLLLVWSAF